VTAVAPMAFARLGWPTFGIGSEVAKLLRHAARSAVALWFDAAVRFVARMDVAAIDGVWHAVDATTEPVMSGAAWQAELSTMSVVAAAVMLPLLCVAALQAVARQDPSGLLRTAFIRVPLALLLTGAVVGLVSLGLQATDSICSALMSGASSRLHNLFTSMDTYLGGPTIAGLAFNFMALVVVGFFAFLVWLELAVRAAAVAAATLFLPLALAGSALPTTAHWARRLGETLAALVLSKLAIVAVLTLAVGTVLDGSGGLSALVEGIALFALSAVAPLALARMLPMIEAGATSHLDGMGQHVLRRSVSFAQGPSQWMSGGGGHREPRRSEGGDANAGITGGDAPGPTRTGPEPRPMRPPPPAAPPAPPSAPPAPPSAPSAPPSAPSAPPSAPSAQPESRHG
jgi:hypothetical protein